MAGIGRHYNTLVVWKLDHLSRSVKSLIKLVSNLNSKNIHFKSLTDSIDTSRFFFHVMASLAQMERELMVERTKAGLNVARKVGRVGERKRVMTNSKLANAKKLLDSGAHPKDIAKDLGVSIDTLYRWIPPPLSQFK